MKRAELASYLRASLPSDYRDCELLEEDGWIRVGTELPTPEGELINVYVCPEESGYVVHDGGWATALRQMLEGDELKPTTYARVVEITEAGQVRLNGLDLVIDGLQLSELEEAITRMACVIQEVTQIGESSETPVTVAAD